MKLGSHHTPAVRAKMAASHTSRILDDPAARAAISSRTRALMAAPEVRKRILERTTAAMADPAVKDRHRAGLKRAYAAPELRQKISERTKAGMAAKLDRQRAELIAVWKRTPRKLRYEFIATHVYNPSA
ncbi:MAG TPA: hypothetical protein VD863_20980 [Bradyrhizobium sp.]|nr:hypothetical protein [Bradyrhizobium sp.]